MVVVMPALADCAYSNAEIFSGAYCSGNSYRIYKIPPLCQSKNICNSMVVQAPIHQRAGTTSMPYGGLIDETQKLKQRDSVLWSVI